MQAMTLGLQVFLRRPAALVHTIYGMCYGSDDDHRSYAASAHAPADAPAAGSAPALAVASASAHAPAPGAPAVPLAGSRRALFPSRDSRAVRPVVRGQTLPHAKPMTPPRVIFGSVSQCVDEEEVINPDNRIRWSEESSEEHR